MSVNFSSNGEIEPLIRSSQEPRRSVWLTVELPIFLLLFSSSLTDTVTYNLLLYRTCTVDLQYNSTKCALLKVLNKTGEAKDLETEVQSEAMVLMTTLSIFSSVMPAVLAVFLGSWSDKYGRKPLVVSPLVGQFVTGVLTVGFSAVQTLSTYWFVTCIMPLAMLGGFSTIMLGANLIISDITNEDNRSFRLALLQGFGFAGVLSGTVASSYMYEVMGYVPMFTVSATIYFITLLYSIVLVKETLGRTERGGLFKIFNFSLIQDMGQTCFKKRGANVAAILFLLITAFGITMFCIFGVGAVDYLFTRQKFQWLLKEYSTFCAVNIIIGLIGMFLGMSFLQSYFKMSDGVLLILSYLSSIADATVRSLSEKSWQMYLENEVDIDALQLLDDVQVRALIPTIGPQAKFKKALSGWKDSLGKDLTLLLQSTPDGQILLKQDPEKPLGEQYRKILTRIISNEILKEDPKAQIKSATYLSWLQEISKLFPLENLESYYTQPRAGLHRAHGRLSDGVSNLKAKYRKHRVYEPRARRSLEKTPAFTSAATTSAHTSSASTSSASSSAASTSNITEEEEECLEWLRCSSDDYAVCVQKWQITNQQRKQRVISNEKVSYLQEFPCLKRSWGYSLLIADFDHWYPENQNSLDDKIPLLKSKLLNLSRNSSTRSPFVEELKQLAQAGTMSVLGSLSPPLIRSQISKVLPQNEIAKMYSLVSCVEAAMPIFAPILFNQAYYYTIAVYPGFIYVISGALFTVCLILVIIANCLYYRVVKNQAQNLLVEEDFMNEN